MDTNSEINGRYFMDKALLNSENENIEYIKCQLNINNHKNNNTKSLEKKIVSEVGNLEINSDLIDRKISSDSTSISNSQIENLSQTSESSNIYSSCNNLNINKQKEIEKEEEKYNYFFGIENYFLKIMPEKFNEYKKSKNFVPKVILKEKEDKKDEIIVLNKNNKINDNKFKENINKNLCSISNKICCPTLGNIFYLLYNPFIYNSHFQKNSNKELKKVDNKNKSLGANPIKYETKIEKNEDRDIFYENNSNDEQNIYILEKQKSYNNRTNQKYIDKKQRNNYKDNINNYFCCYRKNCNFKYKNYNSKHCINNIYYQIKENNYEKNKNYYNYKKYNKVKNFKLIYY